MGNLIVGYLLVGGQFNRHLFAIKNLCVNDILRAGTFAACFVLANEIASANRVSFPMIMKFIVP